MPPVPAVLAALKVTDAPVPLIVPSALLVSDQTYAIPDAGHVALQLGVAVKGWVPLAGTDGPVGLKPMEVKVIGVTVTVNTVEAPFVTALSVALT
jgi:hypothetical protein